MRLLIALFVLVAPAAALAQPLSCLSADPRQWPPASKPYFLVFADTTGGMVTAAPSASSCGFGTTRSGHQRCALKQAFEAYSGQVSFGLATGAVLQQTCATACSCAPTDTVCF